MIRHKITIDRGRIKNDEGLGTSKHNLNTQLAPTSLTYFLRNSTMAHTMSIHFFQLHLIGNAFLPSTASVHDTSCNPPRQNTLSLHDPQH